MAKIVLSRDGKIVDQRFLGDAPLVIGRDGGCDLTVNVPEVSLQQAAINTVVNDHILEDMNSPNGTLVNGKPVRRHLLQNGDVVFLGDYRLKYLNSSAARGMDRTLLLDANQIEEIAELTNCGSFGLGLAAAVAHAARERFARGRLECMAGSAAGRQIEIERIIHPVGKRGDAFAVINRRPSGCFVTHVSGASRVRVNAQPLTDAAVPLTDGDVIEAGDEKYVFHPG
ncbi:MAG: FHA domain-containing protein [Rhodocyclales bacterium]|nr:FHA domain-containing protein [Rhodocyclales bacterium]